MENKSTFKEKVKVFLSDLAEKAGSVETSLEIEITIGNNEIASSTQELPDLESLKTNELHELRNEVQERMDDLQEEEPEELDSEEYDDWEDAIETLSNFLDDIDDRIEETDDEE